MSVSNNIIKAPIGLQEVYSLLGVAKQGTYYDVGYICSNSHGKINKWSKYKPLDNSKTNLTGSEVYANSDGKCGLNITPIKLNSKQEQAFYQIREAYNTSGYWDYVQNTSTRRLQDFAGYQHAAVCPFWTLYKQGSKGEIPYPSSGTVVQSYDMFQIDLEGGDYLPEGNLTINDFTYSYYNGSTFYLRDARLGAVILVGTNNPITYTGSWSSSFSNSAGNFFYSDNTISEDLSNGSSHVNVPVSFFMNVGSNYRNQTYQVVGGIFFGYNNEMFLPLPYNSSHYPHRAWTFAEPARMVFVVECTGWAQHPVYSTWEDIRWIATEDVMAVRPLSSQVFQLRFSMYLMNYTGSGLSLDASNLKVVYSDSVGRRKEGQGEVVNTSWAAVSSGNISTNSNSPTTVRISCDDAMYSYPDVDDEFHLQIYYVGPITSEEFVIYDMWFQASNNY